MDFMGFYAFTNVIAQWETILIKKRDKHVKQPMQSSVFDMDVFFSLPLVSNLWASSAHRHTYIHTHKNKQTNERTNLEIIWDKMSTTPLNLHDNDLKYVLSAYYVCCGFIDWQ